MLAFPVLPEEMAWRRILVPVRWSPFEHLYTCIEYHELHGCGCFHMKEAIYQ